MTVDIDMGKISIKSVLIGTGILVFILLVYIIGLNPVGRKDTLMQKNDAKWLEAILKDRMSHGRNQLGDRQYWENRNYQDPARNKLVAGQYRPMIGGRLNEGSANVDRNQPWGRDGYGPNDRQAWSAERFGDAQGRWYQDGTNKKGVYSNFDKYIGLNKEKLRQDSSMFTSSFPLADNFMTSSTTSYLSDEMQKPGIFDNWRKWFNKFGDASSTSTLPSSTYTASSTTFESEQTSSESSTFVQEQARMVNDPRIIEKQVFDFRPKPVNQAQVFQPSGSEEQTESVFGLDEEDVSKASTEVVSDSADISESTTPAVDVMENLANIPVDERAPFVTSNRPDNVIKGQAWKEKDPNLIEKQVFDVNKKPVNQIEAPNQNLNEKKGSEFGVNAVPVLDVMQKQEYEPLKETVDRVDDPFGETFDRVDDPFGETFDRVDVPSDENFDRVNEPSDETDDPVDVPLDETVDNVDVFLDKTVDRINVDNINDMTETDGEAGVTEDNDVSNIQLNEIQQQIIDQKKFEVDKKIAYVAKINNFADINNVQIEKLNNVVNDDNKVEAPKENEPVKEIDDTNIQSQIRNVAVVNQSASNKVENDSTTLFDPVVQNAQSIVPALNIYDWNTPSAFVINSACIPQQTMSSIFRVCIHSEKDDPDVSGSLKSRGYWEFEAVRDLLLALLKLPNAGLIDIGTGIGVFSLAARSINRPVIGVEPYFPHVAALRKSVFDNGFMTFFPLFMNMISDTHKTVTVRHIEGRPMNDIAIEHVNVTQEGAQAIGKTTLETITLNDIAKVCSLKSAVLKIDLPGLTAAALYESSDLFGKVDIQYIFVNWKKLSEHVKTASVSFFSRLGYRPYRVLDMERLNLADALTWNSTFVIWHKEI